MATQKKSTPAKKATKLPSKPISFSNHPQSKNAKKTNASISSTKKGGVNLMRKLSGM